MAAGRSSYSCTEERKGPGRGEAGRGRPPDLGGPALGHGRQLLRDLRFEVAQLDLLASRTVRQLARDLVETPETETSRLPLMAKPGQDDYEGTEATQGKIEDPRALVGRPPSVPGL